MIGREVARHVGAAPPKVYEVNRTGADGQPVKTQVTLPQAIAELTDQIRTANQQERDLVNTLIALIGELEQQRRLGRAILKRQRKQEEEDDDEDDS